MDQERALSVMPRRASRAFPAGRRGAVMAVVGFLAACAIAWAAFPVLRGHDPHEAALRGLQIRVLAITQAAAENRVESALDALAALERDLDQAAASGLVSAAQFKGIDAALETVRVDLLQAADAGAAAAKAAVIAAAPIPTATPTASPTPAPAPVPIQSSPEEESAPVPAKPGPPADVQEPKGKAKGAGKS